MDVQAPLEGGEGAVQGGPGEGVPGDHLARGAEKGLQQLEFHRGEVDVRSSRADCPPGGVQFDVPGDKPLLGVGGCGGVFPAEDGPYAGQELPGIEGLGQVVVPPPVRGPRSCPLRPPWR